MPKINTKFVLTVCDYENLLLIMGIINQRKLEIYRILHLQIHLSHILKQYNKKICFLPTSQARCSLYA